MNQIDILTGAAAGDTPRPPGGVAKFDEDGAVRCTPGLTTLCHIDRSSEAFAALVEAQDLLKAGPHAHAFAWLPPDSFHMTVWDGVIDHRRGPGDWPAHLPANAPIATVATDFARRLDGFTAPPRFAIRATEILAGFSVRVTGTDPEQEAALRGTRDALSDRLGLRRDNHETYRFHITLGYPLRWLDADAAAEVVARSADAIALAADRLERIEIGPVEFCRFETMHRFDPLRML